VSVDQQLTTFQLLLALALPHCLIISFSLFSARVDPSRRIKNKNKIKTRIRISRRGGFWACLDESKY
jgi:hypothetical protein